MSSYTTVIPQEPSDGRSIWSAAGKGPDGTNAPALYVLTPDAFHWATFGNEAKREAALEAVRTGGDPRALLGRNAVAIPLDGIVGAEKQSWDKGFSLKSQEGGNRWEYVSCPDRLARVIFEALQRRLHPRLRLTKKRQPTLAAARSALGVLFVVWLLTLLTWIAALHADEPPQPGRRFITRTERGMQIMGELLGPTIPLVIGGLATVGILGWAGYRVFTDGPLKKVLVPSRGGLAAIPDEAAEEDEEDSDEDAETEEPAEPSPINVACAACGRKLRVAPAMAGRSVRCPGCRGAVAVPAARPAKKRPKSARPTASKPALLLGAAALVLGVLSLAVGLFTSLSVVALAAAAIGLVAAGAGAVIALKGKHSGVAIPIAGGAVNLLVLVATAVLLLRAPRQPAAEDEPVAAAPGVNPPQGKPPVAAAPGEKLPQGKAPAAAVTAWGEPIDPDQDCTITPAGNALTIRVPPTPHDILAGPKTKANAPRVLREQEGDFHIQVKVCGSIHPMAKASVKGRLPFQAAGLLVWADQDNFVRLVRTGQILKGAFKSIVAFRLRAQGQPSKEGKVFAAPDRDSYLRLERRGKQIEGFHSLDGQQWTPLGSINVPFPARVQVGVMALNTVQEPLVVRFEELQGGR